MITFSLICGMMGLYLGNCVVTITWCKEEGAARATNLLQRFRYVDVHLLMVSSGKCQVTVAVLMMMMRVVADA